MEYNVKVPVVELVDAPTPEQAIDILTDRLRDAGFDVSYAVDGGDSDAFESETNPPRSTFRGIIDGESWTGPLPYNPHDPGGQS